ncbi:helix-turn-helix domain-containing protein [Halanaerobaculum tunisiense]
MIDDVGKRIKKLRKNNNLTLQDLSAKTDLSVGFLSQLERGLTTVAIDVLENIAQELNVNLTYFFDSQSAESDDQIVMRNYENEVFQVDNNQIVHYHLTKNVKNKDILPRLIKILPKKEQEEINTYQHEGEEFIYVLEGIVTLIVNDKEYDLYPGDSAYYSSNTTHNWTNRTNKVAKLLFINTPNVFQEND